jgi:hypothetical protein
MTGPENQVVHPGAEGIEIGERIGHGAQYITALSGRAPAQLASAVSTISR